MDSPDTDLIRLLVLNATILESDSVALSSWWNEEGHEKESLITFLQRQGVLADGVPRMLELSRKGYLRIDNTTTLLREHGQHRLQQGLSRLSPGGRTSTIVAPQLEAGPEQLVSNDFAWTGGETTSTKTVARSHNTHAMNTSRIGELLGKCLLTDEIGRGGFGIVYRALHTTLKIPVAVKMLLTIDSDPEVLDGFRSEALTLAKLGHQNVVRVLDIDNGSVPYFVLEYIEGPSLRELIRQSGRIQVDRAIEIVLQVASGLAAAAALGIVHRDVTPANILLMRDGTAKLTDFGLAAFMADLNASPDLEARGTAAYMSPEQARGDALDSRSDIYSLGATFYHAVTGTPPFSGGTRNQVLLRHAMESPTSPSTLVPEVNPAVSLLILTMMAKSPDGRFPNFDALISALKTLAQTVRPTIDTSESSSSSKKKGAWFSLLSSRHRSSLNT